MWRADRAKQRAKHCADLTGVLRYEGAVLSAQQILIPNNCQGFVMTDTDEIQRFLAQYQGLKQQLDAYRQFADDIQAAQLRLQATLGSAQPVGPAYALTVAAAGGDLDVLMRTGPGPQPTVYHYADDPCGRVTGAGRSPENFKRVPESRVPSRLTRCTACPWPDDD